MTSFWRYDTQNFKTHNSSGSNKQLCLFIVLNIKCYKTVFTWIQETFFLYFCIWEMMGCLTTIHIIKHGLYRYFSENWIKGVVSFSGKLHNIIVLHYYHNIKFCLAYEHTKHKQLKTTTDMHMWQSTWSILYYQYTQIPESLHRSQYYHYTYLIINIQVHYYWNQWPITALKLRSTYINFIQ